MDHSKRTEEFKNIIEKIKLNNTFSVHPEANYLKRYYWEGMLTLRFECASHSEDNPQGNARRRDCVRAFMNDLRKKWKVRKKQIRWISSTEYGSSGIAHCHIIFNFHPLTSKGIHAPCLSNLDEEANESLQRICEVQKITNNSVDLYWSPVTDSSRLVEYVLKIEYDRRFTDKEILWSVDGKAWSEEMAKLYVESFIREEAA